MASIIRDEHIDYVRPSRQLLDFYRKKIGDYESEQESLMKRLDAYSQSHEEEHRLECETRQRNEEIAELQKSLSDMQIFLFKEREQILQLYAENDSFKALDMENKRTIQQLLALKGCSGDSEVSYFFKQPPEQPIIVDKTSHRKSRGSRLAGLSCERVASNRSIKWKELQKPDQVTLQLQIEALQSQLADQERWGKEFLEALEEDKKIKQEEEETRRQRDAEKLKVISEKLHKTQDLLYESTQSMLKCRNEWDEKSHNWAMEKNKMVLELDKCRGRLNVNMQDNPDISVNQPNVSSDHLLKIDNTVKYRQEAKRLRVEIEDTTRMSEMYREQVISLEDDISAYKEKEHVKSDVYKDKTENMSKRYQIMKARYEDLEKRRAFEVEGFKNDIKSLRKQLKDMEKQLYKMAIESDKRVVTGQQDLVTLQRVRKAAGQSLKLRSRLRGVKEQVYDIEGDMRHL
ncbi:coiled-coil domain-containing protein 77-like [Watersipora subatra]|uniref:coiled-coil domain-containing protein 77-like n=1 Tax=Watersipora subatra TaxID=2589382 RepID=UPI00355C7DCB